MRQFCLLTPSNKHKIARVMKGDKDDEQREQWLRIIEMPRPQRVVESR
jgi:hypothetical protein